jgi:hypothetical protein
MAVLVVFTLVDAIAHGNPSIPPFGATVVGLDITAIGFGLLQELLLLHMRLK